MVVYGQGAGAHALEGCMFTGAVGGTWRDARPGGARAMEGGSRRAKWSCAELREGSSKREGAEGWGHLEVHNGANCAKFQNLAQERGQREVERVERERGAHAHSNEGHMSFWE